MPLYGIARLLNGRKTWWMKWLSEIVFEGFCQNKIAKRALGARCISLLVWRPDLTWNVYAVLGIHWHLQKKIKIKKNPDRPTQAKNSGERAIQHIFFVGLITTSWLWVAYIPFSLRWTQHWRPEQTHRHPYSIYQSNHLNWAQRRYQDWGKTHTKSGQIYDIN